MWLVEVLVLAVILFLDGILERLVRSIKIVSLLIFFAIAENVLCLLLELIIAQVIGNLLERVLNLFQLVLVVFFLLLLFIWVILFFMAGRLQLFLSL